MVQLRVVAGLQQANVELVAQLAAAFATIARRDLELGQAHAREAWALTRARLLQRLQPLPTEHDQRVLMASVSLRASAAVLNAVDGDIDHAEEQYGAPVSSDDKKGTKGERCVHFFESADTHLPRCSGLPSAFGRGQRAWRKRRREKIKGATFLLPNKPRL